MKHSVWINSDHTRFHLYQVKNHKTYCGRSTRTMYGYHIASDIRDLPLSKYSGTKVCETCRKAAKQFILSAP